jgi:ribosomal protein S18 acetylase RimI-like enzyme
MVCGGLMLSIREAGEADLPLLCECDASAKAHEWRRTELRRMLVQSCCLLAMAKDGPMGYAVLEYTFFGHGFIPLICVAAAHQGMGIGFRLLSELESRCITAKLFTSCNASNERAQRLFLRAGFVPSGTIDNLDAGDPELVYFKVKAVAAHEGTFGMS